MLGKIYDTLAGISRSYHAHSTHIEQTVVSVEQQHQDYEYNVEQRLAAISTLSITQTLTLPTVRLPTRRLSDTPSS